MSYTLYPKNKLPVKEVQKFILIFYVVGVIGFLLPWTKNLFVFKLTVPAISAADKAVLRAEARFFGL